VRRAGALALLLVAGAAVAHPEPFPRRDRLELSPGGARLQLDYAIAPGIDADGLREQFDRDGRRGLDAAERAQLVAYLADEAARFTALSVDGKPVALARAGVESDLGAGLRVRVTLTARLRLDDGPHRLRLADRHKDRRLAVPVTIALDRLVARALPSEARVDAGHALDLEVAPR
jgi:hypothetical protein